MERGRVVTRRVDTGALAAAEVLATAKALVGAADAVVDAVDVVVSADGDNGDSGVERRVRALARPRPRASRDRDWFRERLVE